MKERATSVKSKDAKDDELRPEYDLSELLQRGTQGKYVERFQGGTNLVMLEPDVAEKFHSDSAVNEALRLVIQLAKVPSGSEEEQILAQPNR